MRDRLGASTNGGMVYVRRTKLTKAAIEFFAKHPTEKLACESCGLPACESADEKVCPKCREAAIACEVDIKAGKAKVVSARVA